MSDPISFPKAVKNRFESYPPAVKLLEEALELAKSGQLQAVALVCVLTDDLEPGGKSTNTWEMGPGTKYALTHGLTHLKARWEQAMLTQE